MNTYVVLVAFFVAVQASNELCYRDADRACKRAGNKEDQLGLMNCNSKYGAIEAVLPDLQTYVNTHITRSLEYLLVSTHYANYEKNRKGFEKLFRDLSDDKWASAIELIKYIGRRGGEMNFQTRKPNRNVTKQYDYEMYELESLAKAVDAEKDLAEDAHYIHEEAARRRKEFHDPEISSYTEEKFVHKHANTVRKLSGYAHDLLKILDSPERALGLYLFDDYLQKE